MSQLNVARPKFSELILLKHLLFNLLRSQNFVLEVATPKLREFLKSNTSNFMFVVISRLWQKKFDFRCTRQDATTVGE
jgi:hypothetical protein